MSQIDWLRLWALNELIARQTLLDRLVLHPDLEGSSYWDFPREPALATSAEERLSRIRECVSAGEISLYVRDENASHHFTHVGLERIDDQTISEKRVLSDYMVVITAMGHSRWESEFRPDWNRFWTFREKHHECGDLLSIQITCATCEMLNEVLRLFPAYRGLDPAFGLQDVQRSTRFGVNVTFWKVLQTAEFVTFEASSGIESMNARFKDVARRSESDPSVVSQFRDWLGQRADEAAMAAQSLRRLSVTWSTQK